MAKFIEIADLAVLGYDTTNTDDQTALDGICELASNIAQNYCRQPFTLTESTEEHSVYVRNGEFKIFPSNLPIVNVETILIQNWFVTTIDVSQFRINSTMSAIIAKTPSVTNAVKNVFVTYKHGFDTIPDELKKAVLLVAQPFLDDYFFTKTTGLGGVQQARAGEQSISRKDENDLTPQVKTMLDKYRRVR